MRIFLLAFIIICLGKVSFSQGTNCFNASPFCTGTTYAFQNNTNVSSVAGPNYGCLTTQPNQAWYYLKIGTSGNIQIGIGQTTGPNGTGTGLDVDFICWGPFTSPTGGCSSGLTAANTIDCSYSTASTETCTIPSAVTGQYYMLLITNFSNQSGYIQFSQVGGTGATDCSILCPLGNGGITSAGALTCTNSPVAIYADESALPVGQSITPCLKFEVPLTDNSGKNILEVYEGSALLGCFKPAASTSTCSPNAGVVPNANKWDVYVSFLDPTQPHTFRMCEDNSASTSGNMSFKIFDCYSTTGIPIASGTWSVNTSVAYPTSCQSIIINPGAGAGQWNFTGSSSFTGPGISTTNWGAAVFNPATAGPGTHVVTYNWNNGQIGAALCAGTKTMAITVSNPFDASFTTPGPFCTSAACATLTPTNTYTLGTSGWSGTGISGNTFCPATSGAGSFPITYSVGTSATCKSSQTNTITVNAVPVANAGSPATLNCTITNTTLSGSGGSAYSWTGPLGGIVSGSNTATPSVSLAGTYTLLAANGTCTNSATVVVSQNTITPSVISSSAVLNCTLTSVNASASTTSTPVSYNWSGTGITSATNIGTITVNQPGTLNYTVTNTSNGCKTTGSTSVTQNTLAPAVASAAGTLNCTLTTVNASATTTTSPVSYNWSGTGITSASNISTITVNQPGTFNYTVTNTSNGCSTSGSQAVTQNTVAPAVASAVSGVLNCTLTTVNASATTTTSPVSYNWSGTGITSASNISTITVNQPGTFNYTVTNTSNGCITTGSQAVTQNTIAPAVASASSGVLNCTLTSVNASATTTTSPVSYNWSGTGITSAANISTITVNQPGTFNYTVTNTSNGCKTTGSQAVTQNTIAPAVTSAASGVLNCTLTTVNASATTTTSPVSYNWSGSSITSATNISTITVNQGGSYNYTVTNTSNGCSTTGSQAVTQNTTAPLASATNATLTCVNTTTVLSGGPATGVTYSWSGSGISGATNTANATATTTGNYTLVTTSTTNGCTNTAVATVTNNLTQPVANAGSTQTLVCGVASVTLSGSATPAGSTANWLGGVCGSATSFTTTACAPGTYTLVATHPVSGCTNTSTVTVSSSTNVPQATVNAITNSITCTNTVVAIGVTLSNSDPVSYSWSGPGISGTNNTATTSASVAGTYSVTITNTVTNCQSSFNVTVPTNTTPVIANATSSATITCSTNTVNISATPTGTNYAYSWSGPGTISNGTTENPTVNVGGNYVVTITDNTNGCSSNFTVTVPSNTIIPTFTLGTAPSLTTTCTAPSATLSGISNADPNAVYTWTTPSSSTITGNPIVNSTPGTYSVIVTNTVNGCSTSATSPATVEVVADAGIPNISLSANSVSITCSNPTPSVSITTTASPVNYSWLPTSGIVPGTETTANPSFTAAGSYSVVVTNTVSGCATSISSNVVDVALNNAVPSITLSSAGNTGTINCINPSVNVTPTVTPNSNLTYTWVPSGVVSSSINDATFTAAGIYTLVVTNTLTGCVSSSTNTANIYSVTSDTISPSASINVVSSNTIIGCGASNGTVSLGSNNSTSPNSPVFSWLPGPTSGANLDVTNSGTYTLVVLDAVNGCSDSTQITISGNTNPPQGVDAGSAVTIACGNSSVALNGVTTSTDAVTYSWSGPSATSIISGYNSNNPIVGETGVYTLTVTNTSNNCSATATVNVTQSIVTASITADQTTGISPLTVNFDGSGSNGATSYSWDFGNGNVAGNMNPSSIFNTGGSYTVTLIASASPCSDTAKIVITVNDGLTLIVPNVFTPNNDGSNDIFTIKSTGVKEISLQVFNRWGQKLYEFSGPNASWDGKVPSGSIAPEGTYFYFVKATGFDEKVIEQNGTVNLFR